MTTDIHTDESASATMIGDEGGQLGIGHIINEDISDKDESDGAGGKEKTIGTEDTWDWDTDVSKTSLFLPAAHKRPRFFHSIFFFSEQIPTLRIYSQRIHTTGRPARRYGRL